MSKVPLTSSFQGSAAQAFYTKMETLFTEMQRLCEEINEMGNDVNPLQIIPQCLLIFHFHHTFH